MARTAEGKALSVRHRQGQIALRARMLRDFGQIWPVWRGDEPSFRLLVSASVPLVGAHRRTSSALATTYYERFRRTEGAGGAPTPRPGAPVDRKALETSLYVTGLNSVRRSLDSGFTIEAAKQNAFVGVSGAITRHVLNGGRDALIKSTASDPAAGGWGRMTGDPCHFCAMLASRGFVYSEDTADFQAHDHCVPADTLVEGPSAELGFRRWYEGELIVIGLAGGGELRITPNHPVLTEHGWVRADLLCEGDEVLHRFGSDLDALRVPNEDHVPTPIEDIWGAAGMDWLRSVPVAAEDFHGDGIGSQGEVDVVAAHGFLAGELGSPFGKFSRDVLHPGTGGASVTNSFSGERDTALVGFGVLDASSGCVGCGSVSGSFLRGQLRGVERGRRSDVPARYFGVSEPSGDYATGYPVLAGEGGFRGPGLVGIGDTGRAFDCVESADALYGNAASFELAADRVGGDSHDGRDLLERLAGGVERRRIVDFRRIGSWSGHVFNLQTVEGWYSANGVIVSNCACEPEPEYEGSELPGRADEYLALWNEATRDSDDPLTAFRQAFAAA